MPLEPLCLYQYDSTDPARYPIKHCYVAVTSALVMANTGHTLTREPRHGGALGQPLRPTRRTVAGQRGCNSITSGDSPHPSTRRKRPLRALEEPKLAHALLVVLVLVAILFQKLPLLEISLEGEQRREASCKEEARGVVARDGEADGEEDEAGVERVPHVPVSWQDSKATPF
jgi:hypothetical protein